MAKKKEIVLRSGAEEVPAGDVNITYEGTRIAGFYEETEATLKTGGTRVLSDIDVTYTGPLPTSTAADAGKVLTVGSTGAAEWAAPTGGENEPVNIDALSTEILTTLMASIQSAETAGLTGFDMHFGVNQTTVEKANLIIQAAKNGAVELDGAVFKVISSTLSNQTPLTEGLEGMGNITFEYPFFSPNAEHQYHVTFMADVNENSSNDVWYPSLTISSWAIKLKNFGSAS